MVMTGLLQFRSGNAISFDDFDFLMTRLRIIRNLETHRCADSNYVCKELSFHQISQFAKDYTERYKYRVASNSQCKQGTSSETNRESRRNSCRTNFRLFET